MMKIYLIALVSLFASCSDPGDEVINVWTRKVSDGGTFFEKTTPVKVSDAIWKKSEDWKLYGLVAKINSRYSGLLLYPAEISDYKAIEKYMKSIE